MTTAQEYRQYAEECLRWARTAKSDAERTQFLEMANVWVQAASMKDGAPPTAPSTAETKRQILS